MGAGLGVGGASEIAEGLAIMRVGKASLGSRVGPVVGGGLASIASLMAGVFWGNSVGPGQGSGVVGRNGLTQSDFPLAI